MLLCRGHVTALQGELDKPIEQFSSNDSTISKDFEQTDLMSSLKFCEIPVIQITKSSRFYN